jgi:hypothetical protein
MGKSGTRTATETTLALHGTPNTDKRGKKPNAEKGGEINVCSTDNN